MLSGSDISNYQGEIDWNTFKNNVNFCIIKASEGSSLIDSWFANNRTQARNANVLRGFYHFARPDLGNTPQAEAQFFINLMNGDPLQQGESVYLDYEVQYSGDNVAWVLSWMQEVEKALGVKPIFYSYQAMLTGYDWTPVVNNNNGLWVATASNDPNNVNFQTGAWSSAMMNQWGTQAIPGISGQVDSDVFYGDANALQAYGYQPSVPQPEPQPTPTPQPAPVPVPTPVPVPPVSDSNPLQTKLNAIHDITYAKWSILPGQNFWVTRLHQIKYIFEKT